MMYISSFESPKPYLFGHYLKNSITALLRYVILAQSTPISLHTEGLVPFVSLSTVGGVGLYQLQTFADMRREVINHFKLLKIPVINNSQYCKILLEIASLKTPVTVRILK